MSERKLCELGPISYINLTRREFDRLAVMAALFPFLKHNFSPFLQPIDKHMLILPRHCRY